jgi:hypothetical protein
MIEFDQKSREALEQLESGDPQEAFRIFREVLEYPCELEEALWPDALSVLARIADPIAGPEFARYLHAASERPRDVDVLDDATRNLYDQGAFHLLFRETFP